MQNEKASSLNRPGSPEDASNFSRNNNAFSATSQALSAESIYSILGGKPKSGGGYLCHCPAHEDKNPSLSVDDGDNGRPLVKCWSGCPQEAVVDALKERGAWPDGSRTAPRRAPVKRSVDQWQPTRTDTPPGSISHPSLGKPSATWSYRDQDGHVLTIDCRFDPKDGKKQVLPYTPGVNTATGQTAWKWQGHPAPRPLYGLDKLAARPDAPVLFCEGCKATDAAQKLLLGVVAMTWPGGSGAVDKADFGPIAGRRVAVWPDADEPGLKAADNVSRRCLDAGAAEVSVIEPPPGKKDGWDLADAEAEGWTPEQVSEWIRDHKSLRANQAPAQKKNIIALDIASFLQKEFPPRQNLLSPWLPAQGLTMVYAYRGIGKTFFALSVAYTVASGGSYLGWDAPAPAGVLYLDGEMPGPVMQIRLAQIVRGFEKEATAPLIIVNPDLQPDGMPKIDTAEGRNLIETLLTDEIKLIVVDNISTLSNAKENDGDAWTGVQEWALKQRSQGRSVLFVHHSGKGGAQRGTSRREDTLDTVIALRRPAEYQPDQGAVFEIHFEKNRGLFGDEVKPIEASLSTDEHGTMTWRTRTVEDSTFDKVVSLLNEGLKQGDIADELGVNKSTVSRHARKAKASGLLTGGAL